MFADRDVENGVGQGNILGVAVDEGKLESMLVLKGTGRGELFGGVVDSDGTAAGAHRPRPDVGRSAPEIDQVLAVQVRQDVEVGLGGCPDAPVRLGRPLLSGTTPEPITVLVVPQATVTEGMVGQRR